MAKSLFNKDISPSCAHCLYGHPSEYSDEVFCIRRGITDKADACRHYKYDVLKRVPNRVKPLSDFKSEDFEL